CCDHESSFGHKWPVAAINHTLNCEVVTRTSSPERFSRGSGVAPDMSAGPPTGCPAGRPDEGPAVTCCQRGRQDAAAGRDGPKIGAETVCPVGETDQTSKWNGKGCFVRKSAKCERRSRKCLGRPDLR